MSSHSTPQNFSDLRRIAPVCFEDILGQEEAVSGLRERIRSEMISGSIILHGPEGVGKRTLARLFAKGLLCQQPLASGSACNTCSECQAIDKGASFGYTEFDARLGDGKKIARRLVDELRGGSFADQTVLVIRSADFYAPDEADVFLKTLEDAPASTTVILLATDLKRMRLAVQSRCVSYRLRPLAHEQAKCLGKTLLEKLQIKSDEPTLELLAVGSDGLPGRLCHLIARLSGEPEITLPVACEKLGYRWANDAISCFSAIFKGDEPSEGLLDSMNEPNPDESMRRLRAFLQHLYARLVCEPPIVSWADPALMCVDDAAWQRFVMCFDEFAELSGSSRKILWRDLAIHFTSCNQFAAANALEVLKLRLSRGQS